MASNCIRTKSIRALLYGCRLCGDLLVVRFHAEAPQLAIAENSSVQTFNVRSLKFKSPESASFLGSKLFIFEKYKKLYFESFDLVSVYLQTITSWSNCVRRAMLELPVNGEYRANVRWILFLTKLDIAIGSGAPVRDHFASKVNEAEQWFF